MPKQRKAENLLFARMPTLKIETINTTNTITSNVHPTKPNSSAIMEKIKSLSLNGKKSSACRLLNKPTPQTPPLPMA